MRLILFILILLNLNVKAQLCCYTCTLSPLSLNTQLSCKNSFVKYYVASNYTLAPLNYLWTNGNASITGTMATISSPGIYTITATTGSVLVHTTTLAISVNTLIPTINLTPLSQTISCNTTGTPVQATSGIAAPQHYFVSPTGGTLFTSGTSASYLPGAPGTYTYILQDSLNGCKSQAMFTVSSPSAFPSFNITSAQNFTLGCATRSLATVAISSAILPGQNLSYTVTSTPVYTLSAVTTYSFLSAGIYTVVVKDNLTACEAKIPISIIGNSFVPIPYGINFDGTITCKEPGLLMHYYQSEPGNYSFGWGLPNLSMPITVAHPYDTLTAFADPTPNSVGYWGPWAIITNNDNDCYTAVATLLDQDNQPPYVSIGANHPNITCINSVVTITSNCHSSYAGFPQGWCSPYLWQGPAPQATSTVSSGYLAYVAGIYTVHVVDQKSGCTNTATLQLNDSRVYPQISAPSQVFELCNGSISIQPIVSSTSSLLYAWNTGTNTVYTSTTLAQITVGSAGIYTVTVIDTLSSCSSSIQLTVMLCTGLNENLYNKNFMLVYPNPTKHSAFVETKSAQHFVLVDELGKALSEQDLKAGKVEIDLSPFPAGIYFIRLNNDYSDQKFFRIIKEN